MEEQLNKGIFKKSIVQQILLHSFVYIRKRSLSLGESTWTSFLDDANFNTNYTDYNIQKTNEHASEKS